MFLNRLKHRNRLYKFNNTTCLMLYSSSVFFSAVVSENEFLFSISLQCKNHSFNKFRSSQNNIPNMLNSSKISINVWPRNWKWAEPELIKLLNIFILCFRPINADNRIRTPPCFFALLTQHSRHQAEDDGANDEGPVPGVRTGHRGNTQEDEDQRLAHAAPHLQEVFDGGVGLVRYVGLHIRPHHHATRY